LTGPFVADIIARELFVGRREQFKIIFRERGGREKNGRAGFEKRGFSLLGKQNLAKIKESKRETNSILKRKAR